MSFLSSQARVVHEQFGSFTALKLANNKGITLLLYMSTVSKLVRPKSLVLSQ